MNIVVCVKFVPDAQSERGFEPGDHTTDRFGVPGRLSELDEYAVEAALTLATAGADAPTGEPAGRVTVMTVGPPAAAEAIKKALQMGADAGVHVTDEAIAGSDAAATSLVLAAAIRRIGEAAPVDLVLTGMASTDAVMSVVPAMLAERLDLPQLTLASQLSIEGGTASIRRDGDLASQTVTAALPALVSVTDQINEPRYPSFKGIMGAKKKPVQTWGIADLGLRADQVGLAASATVVESITPRPPRQAGQVVKDDGDGGRQLADFLRSRKFV